MNLQSSKMKYESRVSFLLPLIYFYVRILSIWQSIIEKLRQFIERSDIYSQVVNANLALVGFQDRVALISPRDTACVFKLSVSGIIKKTKDRSLESLIHVTAWQGHRSVRIIVVSRQSHGWWCRSRVSVNARSIKKRWPRSGADSSSRRRCRE